MMKWGRVAAFVAMLPCVASAGPLDELLPRPKEVRETADGPLSVEGLPSGGYALRVRGGKAEIAAVDEAGRRYAEATLSQLRLLSGDALPRRVITFFRITRKSRSSRMPRISTTAAMASRVR